LGYVSSHENWGLVWRITLCWAIDPGISVKKGEEEEEKNIPTA
jgi:hypothetical protein